MKALVFVRPGSMEIVERPDPVPGPGEVVVAVRAAGICGSDVHGYVGLTGRRRPGVVMGHEAAGDVLRIGPGVASIRPGQRVALRSILPCGRCEDCRSGRFNVCPDRRGLGMHLDGAYAEQTAIPESLAVPLPDSLSYEEGALVEPLAVAMHALNITPFDLMDVVVVIGAGAIGLLTLLAARLRGAGFVAITDRSPHRLALARDFGADLTIDVTSVEPVAAIRLATHGRAADAVFEAVGTSATVAQSVAVVRAGGRVTWIGNSAPTVELPMQELVTRELIMRGSYGFVGEFEQAIELLASGRTEANRLIERRAPLVDGPAVFGELGDGRLDAVKVMLVPNG